MKILKKDIKSELSTVLARGEGIDPEVYTKNKIDKLKQIYRSKINFDTNNPGPTPRYELRSASTFFTPYQVEKNHEAISFLKVLDQKARRVIDRVLKSSQVKVRPSNEGKKSKRNRVGLGEYKTPFFEKRPRDYIPKDESEESRKKRKKTDGNISTLSFGAEAPPRPDHIYRLEEKIREKFEKYLKGQKYPLVKLIEIKDELEEEFKKHPEKIELGWKIEILEKKIDAKKNIQKT